MLVKMDEFVEQQIRRCWLIGIAIVCAFGPQAHTDTYDA